MGAVSTRARGAFQWFRWALRAHPFGPAPVWAGVVTSATIGTTAILRGLDLFSNKVQAVGPTPGGHLAPTLNYYLEYIGAQWFGGFMLLTGVVVLVGVSLRRPIILALGHVIGAGVYMSYLVVLFQGLLVSQDPGGHFAGLRTLATALGAGTLHVVRLLVLTYDVRVAAEKNR